MKYLSLCLIVLLSSCASLQSQHQKIGAACSVAADSLVALTAAEKSGRISKDQLQQAVNAYKLTVPFCEPVAQSLSSVDYAALISASASLSVQAGASK